MKSKINLYVASFRMLAFVDELEPKWIIFAQARQLMLTFATRDVEMDFWLHVDFELWGITCTMSSPIRNRISFILNFDWRKPFWKELWTADGPPKTLIFKAKTQDFGRGREKGAFGASIAGLGAVPQMPPPASYRSAKISKPMISDPWIKYVT